MALLSQNVVIKVIGRSRFQRLLHAGWLKPVERTTDGRILFGPIDVHRALSRAECRKCPPDQIESIRVSMSRIRNGRAYVKKERQKPVWNLDLSALEAACGRYRRELENADSSS